LYVLIVLARHLAIALGRNDSLCLHCFDVLQNGIGIVISSAILTRGERDLSRMGTHLNSTLSV